MLTVKSRRRVSTQTSFSLKRKRWRPICFQRQRYLDKLALSADQLNMDCPDSLRGRQLQYDTSSYRRVGDRGQFRVMGIQEEDVAVCLVEFDTELRRGG